MAWITRVGTTEYFNQVEKDNNAIEFFNFFAPRGYSLESICGMLGNIDQESTCNPGLQYNSSAGSSWGLIQWHPPEMLTFWCAVHGWNWYEGQPQCEKIAEEIENSVDPWIPVSPPYNLSGQQFMQVNNVEFAVRCYFAERERGDPDQAHMPYRIDQGNYYYNLLSGQPIPPGPTPTPTNILGLLMLLVKKRRLHPWS